MLSAQWRRYLGQPMYTHICVRIYPFSQTIKTANNFKRNLFFCAEQKYMNFTVPS